jgi:hypothetical protein
VPFWHPFPYPFPLPSPSLGSGNRKALPEFGLSLKPKDDELLSKIILTEDGKYDFIAFDCVIKFLKDSFPLVSDKIAVTSPLIPKLGFVRFESFEKPVVTAATTKRKTVSNLVIFIYFLDLFPPYLFLLAKSNGVLL